MLNMLTFQLNMKLKIMKTSMYQSWSQLKRSCWIIIPLKPIISTNLESEKSKSWILTIRLKLKWSHTRELNTDRKKKLTICNPRELKKCLNRLLKCKLELLLTMLMNNTLTMSQLKKKYRFHMRLKSMSHTKGLSIRMLLVSIKDLSRELNRSHTKI